MNFENLKVLQTSFIKLCLNQHKPHLELKQVEFMNKKLKYSQNQIEIYDFGHAKVFDHQEQIHKLLIICLYKGYESQTEFYLRVMKTAVRSDILLNLVNHYYLDDNQLFYVFEMECFDETLNAFQQKHFVDGQIINSLKDQITQYFFKTQEIIQDYKQDLQFYQFYIKYTQQKQLQIKVNLIDPSLSDQQLKQKQNQQSIGEQECEGRLENQDEILVNKQQNLDQSQNKTQIDIEDEEKQNFLEAINYISNSINMQIQKNDLVSSVQHFYSNILNFHPLEIFKTVQEYPMYQSFEEISFGEQTFQMKVQKRGQTILLEGSKYSSFDQAQQIAKQYESLIKNNQFFTTFINIELIVINCLQNYVLVEKKYIQQLEKQNNNLYCFEKEYKFNQDKKILITLNNLINFSYLLLIKNQIQITKINPKNIIWNKQQDLVVANVKNQHNDNSNFEQNDFGLQIDSFSFQESSEFYVFIIESKIQNCLKKLNKEYSSLNNLRKATGNAVKQFILSISQCELEMALDQYNKIQNILNNLTSLNDFRSRSIQYSKTDMNRIQITFNLNKSSVKGENNLQKIQNLHINNPSLQIYLKFHAMSFENFICTKKVILENPSIHQIEEMKEIFSEYHSKLLEDLKEIISKYKGILLEEFFDKLIQFIQTQFELEFSLQILDQQFLDLEISQIINKNDLTEYQIQQIQNQNYTVLQFDFSPNGYIDQLKILFLDEGVFFLLGECPYLLLKYTSSKQISNMIKTIFYLNKYKTIFGLDYLHKYYAYQTEKQEVWILNELNSLNLKQLTLNFYETDYAFNISGFNSIIQLNLEFFYFDYYKDKLPQMVEQIQLTNLNTIKLTLIESFYRQIQPKERQLCALYKLKNLVNVIFQQDKHDITYGQEGFDSMTYIDNSF
ncbi:hypothetical protein TTHERM_01263970 (macronuclear) [Tetrahymena thermophila SB210]|uniref:Uncharacterized protein n=1 Tax=Tetrahymena thermophila (strain SB210) TaxID=312017 RepID=Q22A89_TETTS|nr:hypothetical protein TTHERM_01263970 [Tetrahymena thermophila SB210]EAR82209.1 hypothetical protein TTHERM_01263970 [Tetrahymena thermophila SB210]|eukprot:XP_001029872.1 hypothetical protein TTHERM_01263970 [Tetrahymena thermophila SB210]